MIEIDSGALKTSSEDVSFLQASTRLQFDLHEKNHAATEGLQKYDSYF